MGIYIVQWEGLPYVKIGKADSLTARINSFRTASPLPIIVRAWYPEEPDDTEHTWQAQWARCHHTGEWFLPDADMDAWLGTLTIASEWGKPSISARGGERTAVALARAKLAAQWMDRLREETAKHQDGKVN